MTWVEIVKDIGFPVFVALFVLVRLEPAVKRLDNAITALTIVAAKSNGLKAKDITEVLEAVQSHKWKNRGRRVADCVGGDREKATSKDSRSLT